MGWFSAAVCSWERLEWRVSRPSPVARALAVNPRSRRGKGLDPRIKGRVRPIEWDRQKERESQVQGEQWAAEILLKPKTQ